MSCCNRSKSNKGVRSQKIVKNNVKKQRIIKQNKSKEAAENAIKQTADINTLNVVNKARQKITVVPKCKDCGHAIAKVNIAGRERSQCVNPKCRKIVR